MFHGPAYQGVTEMHAMGTDGLRATVTCRPAPGRAARRRRPAARVLDRGRTRPRTASPCRCASTASTSTGRIPSRAPSSTASCASPRSTRPTPAATSTSSGDGRVWARLTQFIDRRFESTNAVFKVMTFPEENLLAERRDGYWVVHEPWRSSASRDLLARRYLGEEERAEYFSLTPKAQRDWLLGRIAVEGRGARPPVAAGARPDLPARGARSPTTTAAGRSSRCPTAGPLAVSLAHRAGRRGGRHRRATGTPASTSRCVEPRSEHVRGHGA